MGCDPAGSRALWSFKPISDLKQSIPWLMTGRENRYGLSSISKGKPQGMSMLPVMLWLVIGNSELGGADFSFSVSILFHPTATDVHISYCWRKLL